MKAFVFDGEAKLREVSDPVPAKDEVLVRVRYSSMCQTDLGILRG